ncbi:MAG: AMP-binding protein, partial [bacterium]|nr:AMP-binding protein [bacterium]
PQDKTIHQLFEEQVQRPPDRVGLVGCDYELGRNIESPDRTRSRQNPAGPVQGEGFSLTYRQLNLKVNQMAGYLHLNNRIQPEDRVAIWLSPTLSRIVAILAVLKTGAAYVPLDVALPVERMAFILEDAGVNLILTENRQLNDLNVLQENGNPLQDYLCIDNPRMWQGDMQAFNGINHETVPFTIDSHSLAYIIYTSGTTGRPKGAGVEHRSAVNMFLWKLDYHRLTEKDHCTQCMMFSFDASVIELFPPLLIGSVLVLVPEAVKVDPSQLNHFYETHDITFSDLPTTIANSFIHLENQSLRTVTSGGDVLRTNSFRPSGYTLYNCYGPTENTVIATAFPVTRSYDNTPLGPPIYNKRIYNLNPG